MAARLGAGDTTLGLGEQLVQGTGPGNAVALGAVHADGPPDIEDFLIFHELRDGLDFHNAADRTVPAIQ